MKCIYCNKPAKRRPDGFVVCRDCTEQNKVYTAMQKQAEKIRKLREALQAIDALLQHNYAGNNYLVALACIDQLTSIVRRMAQLESEDGGRRFPTKAECAEARAVLELWGLQ